MTQLEAISTVLAAICDLPGADERGHSLCRARKVLERKLDQLKRKRDRRRPGPLYATIISVTE